ncbi:MAG: hypothetical protein K2X47_08830 [Bdellovibrionales bacterium]|nr:hypothetical protein [Bdellovibrionales bacterium]
MNIPFLMCALLNCASWGIFSVEEKSAPLPNCPPQINMQLVDRTQVYHFQSGKKCMIYLSSDAKELKFRSYAFTSEGLFQIFNSFAEGDESVSAGARVYFFFPEKNNFQYAWNGKDRIQLTTASGTLIDFASNKLRILGTNQGKLTEDPKISGLNQGGVEVSNFPDWYVDSGFKVGASPFLDQKRTSLFVGPQGQACAIPNRELFIYDPQTGDGKLRPRLEVFQLYQKHCPTP